MDPSDSVSNFGLSLFVFLQANIFNAPSTGVLFACLVIVLLVACSALMAASEIAFFSISNAEREELRESDDDQDKRLVKLLDRPRYLLSTILIANNLVNIGVIVTFYYVITSTFVFRDFSLGSFTIPKELFDFLMNVIVVTFVLVLFGEAIPKVYATHNKMSMARRMAAFFTGLNRLFSPINFVLVGSTAVIEKRIKRHNAEMDIEEINKAIDITVDDGDTKNDIKMLKGIVHFGNITVKQVMRPRMEVAAANWEWTFKELLAYVNEVGYSRLPVFKEDIDHIEGVLYIKDLLQHIHQDENFGWQSLVREAVHAPENKKIDDMLREFQESRKHLAIVVDEFGGTSGIITLEDIVEEVIGDIKDEFDESADANYKKINDTTFIFEGSTPLVDFCKVIQSPADRFEEIKGDAETVAGLVLELKGKIPKAGEEVNCEDIVFRILSLKSNRIEKVKVTLGLN